MLPHNGHPLSAPALFYHNRFDLFDCSTAVLYLRSNISPKVLPKNINLTAISVRGIVENLFGCSAIQNNLCGGERFGHGFSAKAQNTKGWLKGYELVVQYGGER